MFCQSVALRIVSDKHNHMPTFDKYGLKWQEGTDALQIELYCIRHGGRWTIGNGTYGIGMFEHYMNARALIWPTRYRHRWTDLIYKESLQNRMTVLMGAASTGKSSTAAEIVLISYWASPDNTCVLISSTTKDKLESAIWGEVKMLWSAGRKNYPWLAGSMLDYKLAITTDDLDDFDDDDVRDMRRGIFCKPCYVGSRYVGLGVFAGIKQERLWFLCDELQFMSSTFLDCLPNMSSNTGGGGLKVIGSGNTRHNPDDQLGIAAEPKEGWASVQDITKTTVWDTNFFNSRCVNLVGVDSPNYDFPEGKEPYPKLIGRQFQKIISHDYGENSPEYETQVMGRMCLSLAEKRVITRQICRDHGAHNPAVWDGPDITKIMSVDPAYGGGDRCVETLLEFGKDINGLNIIRVVGYKVIKINLKDTNSPEDQIATELKRDADAAQVPYSNIFYDSFGKGTIGFAFARVFGADSPVPVDSGGRTTDRPVRDDLYIDDPKTKQRRLKKCSEHYSKFVTEMWFSVRYLTEANQMRELPIEIMLEGCTRKYYDVLGDKIEVEPKDDMRERTKKSPDFFDSLAVGVEGARRRGFTISKLANEERSPKKSKSTLEKQARDLRSLHQSRQLAQV